VDKSPRLFQNIWRSGMDLDAEVSLRKVALPQTELRGSLLAT